MSMAEAEDLAGANDMSACRDGTRKLRLAGVAVPPPLLALAALDLKFFAAPPQPDANAQPAEPQPQQ